MRRRASKSRARARGAGCALKMNDCRWYAEEEEAQPNERRRGCALIRTSSRSDWTHPALRTTRLVDLCLLVELLEQQRVVRVVARAVLVGAVSSPHFRSLARGPRCKLIELEREARPLGLPMEWNRSTGQQRVEKFTIRSIV